MPTLDLTLNRYAVRKEIDTLWRLAELDLERHDMTSYFKAMTKVNYLERLLVADQEERES